MNLFITSSPYLNGVNQAILNEENDFVDRLRQVLPPLPQVLFVCADPDAFELTCRFGADTVSAFALAGIPFRGFQVLSGCNADEASRLIAQSDFIVLSGGHVPTQNAFFQDIGLASMLRHFTGTVMGISAGSMNMAETVYVQPEEEGESAPDFERFAPGLGLTDVNILPHYQKVKHYHLDGRRLYEDITYADSYGQMFFVLPDGSYLYQDENQLLLCGESYCIHDGVLDLIQSSGDVQDLNTWSYFMDESF